MTRRPPRPRRQWGEERGVSGGVCDSGTQEEDGPVTWEALASPRPMPVWRRAGDPSPTHDTGAGARVGGPRGPAQAPAAREATGQGHWSRGRRGQGVGGLQRSGDVGARRGVRTRPSPGGPWRGALQEGTLAQAAPWEARSPGRVQGVERAQRAPAGRFHALAQVIDRPALERASHRQHAEAAVGVDGVTKAPYGQNVEANLQARHVRLKAPPSRPQPLRRVHLPQGQGTTRPMGMSACEDTVVQDAVREVLEAIYAQDFVDASYGFRPGRSAHDAIRPLAQMVHRGEGQGICEADLVSCCASVERTALQQRRDRRVANGSRLRRIGQCVHVGGLDGEAVREPARGTTPGSVRSPLLGNVYLHDVLDQGFAAEVKPRLRGQGNPDPLW